VRYFVRFFFASLTASVYEHAAARFVQQSPLRRIAQNQIKLDAGKGSQKTKRKRMGWSDDYLQGLFGLTPCSALQPQDPAAG
jgi:hypothetical protein